MIHNVMTPYNPAGGPRAHDVAERHPPDQFRSQPDVRVIRRDNEVHVFAELPGVNVQSVAISVVGRTLTLKGAHCRYGTVVHVAELPAPVLLSGLRTAVRGCQLEIRLPVEPAAG